jgi:hypothetical protein
MFSVFLRVNVCLATSILNKTLKNAFHPQFPIFQSNIVKHVKWYGQKHQS